MASNITQSSVGGGGVQQQQPGMMSNEQYQMFQAAMSGSAPMGGQQSGNNTYSQGQPQNAMMFMGTQGPPIAGGNPLLSGNGFGQHNFGVPNNNGGYSYSGVMEFLREQESRVNDREIKLIGEKR